MNRVGGSGREPVAPAEGILDFRGLRTGVCGHCLDAFTGGKTCGNDLGFHPEPGDDGPAKPNRGIQSNGVTVGMGDGQQETRGEAVGPVVEGLAPRYRAASARQ